MDIPFAFIYSPPPNSYLSPSSSSLSSPILEEITAGTDFETENHNLSCASRLHISIEENRKKIELCCHHQISIAGIPSELMGGISDNVRGLALAISSSIFIGSSFIIKKKGLKKAGASGTRASKGGYSYLLEPWWWAGMLTMLVGEGANFAAYAYAPATLVTPLGALSIIFSAILAHFILGESLHMFGVVGCVLCLVGSVSIVLHAPLEKDFESVMQVWHQATEPGFIIYTFIVLVLVVILIFWCVPRYGQTHMVVYIGICSLMGSLTVMGVKAVGLALKLSFSGSNQFIYFVTWFFTILVIVFCVMQLIYLNKALDTFNTAVVSPVYYVMFTTLTIVASIIMFKEWDSQNASQIMTELCGFVTILCGTLLLHKTRDMGGSPNISSPGFHPSYREQGA